MLLVVSELVTNAVRHSGMSPSPNHGAIPGYLELGVSVWADHVRVEVHDNERRLPVHVAAHDFAESGRGMEIIEFCACRWGAHRLCTGGKIVWCSVSMNGSSCRGSSVTKTPRIRAT